MKRALLVIILVLVCVATVALPALADSQARIVRLSYVSGSVQIDRNTGQGFERAVMNVPITQGAQLRTQDGQAEVEFENGSTVRLTPETTISFEQLTLTDDGTKSTQINLLRGVAYFNLDHKDHNEFHVQVSGRDLAVKKSAHFRADMSRGQTRIAVFKGEVEYPGPTKQVAIHKNETLAFDPDQPAQYAMAKGVDEYQYDTWDKQRQEYQVQYTAAKYSRGVPYYGWDDLNYYGQFGYYPGYGYLWRPYGVGYGWSPFDVGYWMWYPAFGYTWVSPYAWGWTPYRYGSWVFLPGYGWNWRPGGWNTWHNIPPVQGAPPFYRHPVTPPAGGGTVAIGHPHPAANAPVGALWQGGNSATSPRILPTPDIRGHGVPPATTVRSFPGPRPGGGNGAPPPARVFTPSGGSGRGSFGGSNPGSSGAAHGGAGSAGGGAGHSGGSGHSSGGPGSGGVHRSH